MGHVQNTMQRVRAGRLKWTALTSGQAHRFETLQAKSPCSRAPGLLNGLPMIGADHEPREAITQKPRNLITDHNYTETFEQAIRTVSQQGIAELDRIHTLNQFFLSG